MKKYFMFITALFLVCTYAQAQPKQAIIGQLVDADGTPLSYATIRVLALPDSALIAGTVADADGLFKVTAHYTGQAVLLAAFYGKIPYQTVLPPNQPKVMLGLIKLQDDLRALDEVEIIAERLGNYQNANKQVFDAATFENAKGGTATDVLANLPGVATNINGNITIRGKTDFLLLIDGRPVQADPQMILNALPANAISNIEVSAVGSATNDADGGGGVLNIVTRKATKNGFFAQVNLQGGLPSIENYGNARQTTRYGADATVYYQTNKLNISGSVNYNRNDLAGFRVSDAYVYRPDGVVSAFPAIGERSYYRWFYGARLAIDYALNPKHQLTLNASQYTRRQRRFAYIVFNSQRYNPTTNQTLGTHSYYNPNEQQRNGDFSFASLDYQFQINQKTTLNTSVLYEYTFLEGPTDNPEFNQPQRNQLLLHVKSTNPSPLHGLRLRTDLKHQTQNGYWQAGVQYRHMVNYIDFDYNMLNLQTNNWQPVAEFTNYVDFGRDVYAAYAEYAGKWGKLQYTAGLRTELARRRLTHNRSNGTIYFDLLSPLPSVSGSYALSRTTTLTAGYNRRISRNTLAQLNPFPEREHSYVLEQGDDNLRPEITDLAQVGLNWDKQKLNGFVNVFYRYTQNVINRYNSVFNDTIFNRIYSNVGNGQAVGIEPYVQYKPTGWLQLSFGGMFYQYNLQGNYKINDAVLPVSTSLFQYSLSPRVDVQLPKNFSLQLSLNYLSERVTAQGHDDEFYNPALAISKKMLNKRLNISLQWLNIDMGLWESNEQQITTRGPGFYGTVNYIYEVDIIMLQCSWQLSNFGKRKFAQSEFGEREY